MSVTYQSFRVAELLLVAPILTASFVVGEGSKHIRPNQASDVHELVLAVLDTVECDVGGDVTEWRCLVEDRSWQPKKRPGVLQWLWVVEDGANVWLSLRCPVGLTVVVIVGLGVAPVLDVCVGSLQPNQPGVLQLVVVGVVSRVVVDVEVVVVVVDSSRQPHQPGVLHVDVRVRVLDVLDVRDVVVSEPLLSKNFQLKQSTHSVSAVHAGSSSYASMTFLITPRILWFPIPTLQPLSSTVS